MSEMSRYCEGHPKVSALAKVPDALDRYKAAEKSLAKAMERAYPIGTIVAATLGNARVRGPVQWTGATGYYLGYVGITNEETGKARRFYAADRSLHDVEIIAYQTCICKPHQTYHQPPCPLFNINDREPEPRARGVESGERSR